MAETLRICLQIAALQLRVVVAERKAYVLAGLSLIALCCLGCGSSAHSAEKAEKKAPARPVVAEAKDRPAPDRTSLRAPPHLMRLPADVALQIEHAVLTEIERGATPGAAIAIGDSEHVWFAASYGGLERGEGARLVDNRTIYDLSSLTKPLVTALAVAQLVDQKKISYEDKVAKYLPCFGRQANQPGKKRVTIAQLLLHTSGLPPIVARKTYEGKPRAQALASLCQSKLGTTPAKAFRYSDLGYVLLGYLVEQVSGQSLDAYFQQHIAKPLQLTTTQFGPLPDALVQTCVAPTEYTEHRGQARELICGQTHDPVAWRLGGVAGNAGLFSTLADLSRFAQSLLRLGRSPQNPDALLSPAAYQAFIKPRDVPGGKRNYGWDVETGYSKQRADGFSDLAFGHSGFAGTSLWLDPKLDMYVLFLSNRVYPDGRGEVRPLQRRVSELALAGRERVYRGADPEVMNGIDVLELEEFASLQGRSVGLITNNAARTRDGRRTIDALVAGGVQLLRLFSPEHGLSATREGKIGDGVDVRTGTPVVSLFGKDKQPRSDAFAGLDVVLFDLQDVGTRFYTYQATMRRAMEAAASQNVRFIVLDRPNPLGGDRILGPLLDSHNRGTFINHHALPLLHGMTMAEVAGLFKEELSLSGVHNVAALRGWDRAMRFDDTRLPWFAPSPNLPDTSTVAIYPAVALIEGTDVSVGRGTDEPFRVIGAPRFDAKAFRAALLETDLAGLTVEPASFVPESGRHRRRRCAGVRLKFEDTGQVDIQRLGYALVLALVRTQTHIDPSRVEKMIGDRYVTQRLLRAPKSEPSKVVIESAVEASKRSLQTFSSLRAAHLIYP